MYMLGTSNAIPFLELLAYAGYPFVPICTSLLARLTLGQHCETCTLCIAPKRSKPRSQDAPAEHHHHGRPVPSPLSLLLSGMTYNCFRMGMHGIV